MSSLNPPDGKILRAKREFVVPNGIEDNYAITNIGKQNEDSVPEILYVGVLRESKGVMVLLEAAKILRERDLDFRLRFVGKFESEIFSRFPRAYARGPLPIIDRKPRFDASDGKT